MKKDMTNKSISTMVRYMVNVMSFFYMIAAPCIVSAQNTHDHELNVLWDQAEFWETAGNADKMFEY